MEKGQREKRLCSFRDFHFLQLSPINQFFFPFFSTNKKTPLLLNFPQIIHKMYEKYQDPVGNKSQSFVTEEQLGRGRTCSPVQLPETH